MKIHVLECVLGGDPLGLVGEGVRHRHILAQRDTLARVGAPGDERRQGGSVDYDLGVEHGVVVGPQAPPVLDGRIPFCAGRRMGTPLQVVKGGLVRGDHAGARAGFDAHVAHGHARLHRELLNGFTAVLDDVPLAAAGTDLGDHGQDQVLGRDAGGQLARDRDRHGLEGAQRQGLGGHDVLHLGGTDPHGDGAERAVRRGVRVSAHHRHARLGEAELGAHHVDDALLEITHRVQPDAELLAVAAQRLDLRARGLVGDEVDRAADDVGGHIVILGRQREVGTTQLTPRESKSVERLGAGHLVDKMKVDEDEVGLARLTLALSPGDHMVVPDLLRQGPRPTASGYRLAHHVSKSTPQASKRWILTM